MAVRKRERARELRRKKGAKRKRALYGGIDCGKKGWMILYDGTKVIAADPLPWLDRDPDLTDLVRYFKRWKSLGVEFVFIEDQQVFGQDTAVSAFSLGGGFWTLQAIMAALEIPFATITSAEWRKGVGIKIPTSKTLSKLKGKLTKKRKAERAKARRIIKAARDKKLKARSISTAQRLQPGYDFRTSSAWNSVPNDNKAEAFLMSVVAYRRHGRAP